MSADPLTEVDLMIAAQAMRELVNRFPRVSGTLPLQPGRSTRDDVKKFVEIWEAHSAQVEPTDGDGGIFEVPQPVIAAAQDLVSNFRAGSASNWRLRSALVLGRIDVDSDPTVKAVARSVESFEKVRHPQGDTTAWLETEAVRVRTAIEVVENALEARLGSFFGVVDQLKEILDRANDPQVGRDGTVTWSPPDERDLREVMSRLGDVQHRRVFFGSLRNPLWLDPLADRDWFARTPLHELDTAGRGIWTIWPEGEFLAAIAATEPARVAAILSQAVKSGAAYDARAQLMKAALAMPPDNAATLVKTLEQFIDPAMNFQFGYDLVRLIEKLATGGRLRKARNLAWKLLRPRPGADRWSGTEVESVLDRHLYAEALKRVLSALRNEPTLMSWLANRLADAERIARPGSATDGHDFSYIWRPAIGNPSTRYDRDDVRHVLVDSVRDVAMERLAEGRPVEEVIGTLEGTGAPLLLRIAMYVLAQHAMASNPPDQATLDLGFRRLISGEIIDSDAARAEYLLLGRGVLPHVTDVNFEEWSSIFAAYPRLEPQQVAWIANHLGEGESLKDALADRAESWRHDQLAAIGAGALRGSALAELAGLNVKRGKLGESEKTGETQSSSDDYPSPLNADQLSAMTADGVIEILRTYEPESDDRSHSDKDGLSQEFRAVVQRRTFDYSRVADAVLTLPHLYVTQYLDGLREGVSDHGGQLDWASLIPALLNLPSSSEGHRPAEGLGSFEWGYPIRQALAVVGLGARKGASALPLELLPAAAAFAARYLADPDPAPDLEPDGADEEPTYGSDPYLQSLNAVRSSAIRVMAGLAMYEHEETDVCAQPGPVVTFTAERLSLLLTPSRDGSSAIAAALGEAYGRILAFAPEWIDQHRAKLLSADTFGDIVVTTALVIYRTSRPLLESLTRNIADLISRASRGDRIVEGWKVDRTPLQQIGDHLMVMYLWGGYDLDTPPVDQFFREAPPETRGSVLGHLGWLFLSDAEIPEDSLQRAQRLWDARADEVTAARADPAELGDFFWWVHCGKFPIDWWLPRLKQVADATDVQGRTYLGEHLAEAARINPRVAIEVLSELLQSAPEPMTRYNLIANAPEIIARALDCGDAAAAQEAQGLMDWLGKMGNLEIKDRVGQARFGG